MKWGRGEKEETFTYIHSYVIYHNFQIYVIINLFLYICEYFVIVACVYMCIYIKNIIYRLGTLTVVVGCRLWIGSQLP